MGLDMYLTKKIHIGANYEHNNVTGGINLLKNGKPITVNLSKVTYIQEDAGYWRKANQVHNWFIKNVQDGVDNCSEYYVGSDKMKDLLSTCQQIKKHCKLVAGAITNGYTLEAGIKMPIVKEGMEMTNQEFAHKLLPTKSGFFFGNTDYDQYYMDDIDNTIEILEAAIKDENADYYYHSSW